MPRTASLPQLREVAFGLSREWEGRGEAGFAPEAAIRLSGASR